jgi:hypothetical protein
MVEAVKVMMLPRKLAKSQTWTGSGKPVIAIRDLKARSGLLVTLTFSKVHEGEESEAGSVANVLAL